MGPTTKRRPRGPHGIRDVTPRGRRASTGGHAVYVIRRPNEENDSQ